MKLLDVNTTDIDGAIRLGCRTMTRVFDADDEFRPFFGSQVRPLARFEFNRWHSEAHVPGRHLNALLSAADALGLEIPADAVARHARAAFFSYSGPVPLPLNRERKSDPRPQRFIEHNVREGFHALYALARYRDDESARALAERSIEYILRHWDPARGWSAAARATAGAQWVEGDGSTFITGLARAIGPLAKYYHATGSARALELALMLKEKALAEYFRPGARYDRAQFGPHTHSTTCTLSGLAQLADARGDAALLARVAEFYRDGLGEIRDALGWVIESANRQGAEADVGEVNNTGDLVETALLLGQHGHAGAYDDAERILRSHLLPAQLRDTSSIVDPPNPEGIDGLRDVADRHQGAFGFPAPYGHQAAGVDWVSFNLDIVGGAVGSLAEAYRHCVRRDARGIRVNLLFDAETEDARVESPYAGSPLRVTAKRSGPLWVRIPSWVPADALAINPAAGPWQRDADAVLFPAPPVNRPIAIAFPLAERELVLAHRAHDIRVRLRGDAVVAMDNFGADLTFFDPR